MGYVFWCSTCKFDHSGNCTGKIQEPVTKRRFFLDITGMNLIDAAIKLAQSAKSEAVYCNLDDYLSNKLGGDSHKVLFDRDSAVYIRPNAYVAKNRILAFPSLD